MNDNQPMAIGDRVRLRHFPLEGTIWSLTERNGLVAVIWDDPEQEVYVRARSLEVIPGSPLQIG